MFVDSKVESYSSNTYNYSFFLTEMQTDYSLQVLADMVLWGSGAGNPTNYRYQKSSLSEPTLLKISIGKVRWSCSVSKVRKFESEVQLTMNNKLIQQK